MLIENVMFAWCDTKIFNIFLNTPALKECTVEQFQCQTDSKRPSGALKFGECISQVFLCDGEEDCMDKSDENQELCKNVGACENSTLYKKCDNGLCLDKRFWCDTVNNCGDYSDERGCVHNETKGKWVCKILQ